MHGVQLTQLDSSDMLDVIHYIFELDLSVSTSEEVDVKDSYRKSIYENLYGVSYNYAKSSSNRSSGNNYDLLDDPVDDLREDKELPAHSKPPKPYVPPTNFNPDLVNPFAGSKLDAPLN